MKNDYYKLEKIGRIRLSNNFYMRQFLYSEIGAAFGIINTPTNLDLTVEVGERLCNQILEPIIQEFGPIIVRSGYRSAKLNQFGSTNRLNCASNKNNYAHHIWDHLDLNGCKGGSACIVIPALVDMSDNKQAVRQIVKFSQTSLNFNYMTFYSNDLAFNIGWHEKPNALIRLGKCRKLFSHDEANDILNRGSKLVGF